MSAMVLEPLALREAFSSFPCGVTAVAARVDGQRVGLAASSFTSVSLDPPLVSVCVAKSSRTWPRLRRARRIGLSVLADEHERVCRQLSARTGDRFAGLPWREAVHGALLLDGAAAHLQCAIERELDAGDHVLVLLRVHDLAADHTVAPLVFHGRRYRRLAELQDSAMTAAADARSV